MFILIKLAFILVNNQGIFWDEACHSTPKSYTHFSLRIELAATKGTHHSAYSSDTTVLMVENYSKSGLAIHNSCVECLWRGHRSWYWGDSSTLCENVVVEKLWQKGHNIPFGDQIVGPGKMLSGLVSLRKPWWSWNNLGRKTKGFFISWHRNEWIFIPNAKQALNPRTINGENSIPGTITGFFCVLTVKTVPQGFKGTCGLLFLFLSKQKWRKNKHFLQWWMPRISPYLIPTLTPTQGSLIFSGLKPPGHIVNLRLDLKPAGHPLW